MFNGEAEAAANFYAKALDGTIGELHRYGAFPPHPGCPPLTEEQKQLVGHTCVSTDEWTMGLADTVLGGTNFGNGLMLTCVCKSVEEAEKRWKNLSEGAIKILCPLQETFYAKRYGELTDRFGVLWGVMYE